MIRLATGIFGGTCLIALVLSQPAMGEPSGQSARKAYSQSAQRVAPEADAGPGLTDSMAAAIAMEYMEANKGDWQSGDTTIEIRPFHVTSGYTKSGHVRIVIFGQYYRGLPVFYGRVYVSVSEDGKILDVNDHLAQGIETKTTPAISADEAFNKILAETPGLVKEDIKGVKKELVVAADYSGGRAALCWSFAISTNDIGKSWTCMVDAITGEIRVCGAEIDP
jgi:Zn-dependent metalloprotease